MHKSSKIRIAYNALLVAFKVGIRDEFFDSCASCKFLKLGYMTRLDSPSSKRLRMAACSSLASSILKIR